MLKIYTLVHLPVIELCSSQLHGEKNSSFSAGTVEKDLWPVLYRMVTAGFKIVVVPNT